jgi:hypothetical protein
VPVALAAPARLAMAAVSLLIVALPFERVLFQLPGGLTVTTLEAVAAAALALCGWALAVRRAEIHWPGPTLPGVALVAVFLVAALMAPADVPNALRFVARMAMAGLGALVVANIVREVSQVRTIVRAFVGIAALVAAVAVLEALQVASVMNALTVFRPGFHVVGGQLRATGTFMYPTIASMFFEVAFALGLWLVIEPAPRARRERLLAIVALATIGAGIAATFTRAGLLGVGAATALMALVVWRCGRSRVQLGSLAVVAISVVTAVFLLHSPELLATRMSTEGSQAWYGARYEVPPTLQLETGSLREVDVTLTNTGRLTWDSSREPAFALAYHWLRSGSDAVVQFDGQRSRFPRPVAPGQRIALRAAVIAPGQAGDYTLVWDVVHETRAWLSAEGVPPARSDVRVSGAPRAAVVTTMPRLPRAAARPARPELWSAALAMARDRPWLGIGPDNFRLHYGRYAGIDRPDPRVHANNMYLEILAGAGLPGLAALLWLVIAVVAALARRTLTAPRDRVFAAAAFLAAVIVIAGHGLVDSFLSFTSTYLTFAVVAGAAFSFAWGVGPVAPVHRTAPSAPVASDAPVAPGTHAYRV